MSLDIYLGTYDGHVIHLSGSPTSLKLVASPSISQNSIRSICCSFTQLIAGGYDQQLRLLDIDSCVQSKEDKEGSGIVNCIASLKKGQVAVGLDNGKIRFWNIDNWAGKDVKGHKGAVREIKAVNQKGIMVSVGGKEMIVWNTIEKKAVYHYRVEHQLEGVLLVEDFSTIFMMTAKEIHQFATQTNTETHKCDTSEKIQCSLLFGAYIIVGSELGNILIYQTSSYLHRMSFKAHSIRVKCLKMINFEDADYLISVSSEGQLAVWDILQFLKGVDGIGQQYKLDGLKPIFQIQTKKRVICMDAAIKEIKTQKLKVNKLKTKMQNQPSIKPKNQQTINETTTKVQKKKKIKKMQKIDKIKHKK